MLIVSLCRSCRAHDIAHRFVEITAKHNKRDRPASQLPERPTLPEVAVYDTITLNNGI